MEILLPMVSIGLTHLGLTCHFSLSSFNITIKVALAHPAASNGVCSRHRSGYNGTIKNRLFSFAYMLLFLLFSLIFNLVFDNNRSCSISHGSNISPIAPHFAIP
jgi:hypothetical protein